MNSFSKIFHTYKQATWRIQLQWIGLFLACLMSIVLIASLYMVVNTRTALAGREISFGRRDISAIQQNISDLESSVASLSSTRIMQERATALGYFPANPEEFTFVVVPGYRLQQVVSLGFPISNVSTPLILPEYTESLFDWFLGRGKP